MRVGNHVIGFSFTVWTKKSVKKVRKQVVKRMLTKFVSIGSYYYVLLVLL